MKQQQQQQLLSTVTPFPTSLALLLLASSLLSLVALVTVLVTRDRPFVWFVPVLWLLTAAYHIAVFFFSRRRKGPPPLPNPGLQESLDSDVVRNMVNNSKSSVYVPAAFGASSRGSAGHVSDDPSSYSRPKLSLQSTSSVTELTHESAHDQEERHVELGDGDATSTTVATQQQQQQKRHRPYDAVSLSLSEGDDPTSPLRASKEMPPPLDHHTGRGKTQDPRALPSFTTTLSHLLTLVALSLLWTCAALSPYLLVLASAGKTPSSVQPQSQGEGGGDKAVLPDVGTFLARNGVVTLLEAIFLWALFVVFWGKRREKLTEGRFIRMENC